MTPATPAPIRRGPVPVFLAAAVALFLAASLPGNADAQGFGVYEHGACAMGLADGAVARPCDDGSALFYNPAALAGTGGTRVSAGVSSILLDGEFTSDEGGETTEMDSEWAYVPHVYASHAVAEGLVAGLGVYAPYGLSSRWPTDFEGRFIGYDNTLQSIFVQPTLAYRLTDRLEVGVGPTVVLGSVELHRRLDLADQPVPPGSGAPAGTTLGDLGIPAGTDFADAALDATADVAVGVNAGVRYRPVDRVSLGLRYLSEVALEYDGDVDFEPVPTGLQLPAGNPFGVPAGTPLDDVIQSLGLFSAPGPLADQGVTTRIAMPAQLQAGIAVELRPDLMAFADYHRVGWSSFDRITLDFENAATPDDVQIQGYGDTDALRLGLEYALASGLELRVGYVASEAAAPPETVTPLLPDASRDIFSGSVGWSGSSGLGVDVGFLHLDQPGRRGRVRNPPSGEAPTTALNSGVYDVTIYVVGAGVSYRF